MSNWQVGMIGLGKMGGAIAESILNNGYSLTVYDVNEHAVNEFVEKGAAKVNQPGDLSERADIIITSLPNTEIVKKTYETLLQKTKENVVFIEMSTIDPNFVRGLNTDIQTRQSVLIDLPVSGSPEEAKKGELVLMAGGPEETVNELKPLFDCFAKQIHYIGEAGTAKAVKIVNNLMTLGNVAVAAEAFSVGLKFGIEPNLLFNVLNQSGGRSHHFGKRFPHALKRDFEGRFSVALGEKDVGIGLDLSQQLDIPTPIASLVQQIYRVAKKEGYSSEDVVSVLKLYEKWGGIDEEIYKN